MPAAAAARAIDVARDVERAHVGTDGELPELADARRGCGHYGPPSDWTELEPQ